MRLHRFYIGREKDSKNQGFSVFEGDVLVKNKKSLSDTSTSDGIVLDGGLVGVFAPIIHQWKNVFRYTVGSRVVLFDDSDVECVCIIESISLSKASLIILEKIIKDKKNSAEGDLWMFVSILKNDNFDLITQKMTELGVNHIVPLICDRTIKKNVNMGRLEKIAIEASEQSGRISVPVIHAPVDLQKGIDDFLALDGEALVCHQNGQPWSESISSFKKYPLGFLIGPEGGWSEREEKIFEKMALRKVKFSDHVLRAETAAISVVALARVG